MYVHRRNLGAHLSRDPATIASSTSSIDTKSTEYHNEIERSVIKFYNEGKWREIVELSGTMGNCTASKFRLFWVLPTLDDLRFLNNLTQRYQLRGVMSIGCGCGLLEWLLQQYSALSVVGIELDERWWHSKHSPPLFLRDVEFIDNTETRVATVPRHYALLFCYFNNSEAFVEYMKCYKGDLIFVIGPGTAEPRSTNPSPFDSEFQKYGWTLIAAQDITHSKDCVVAYGRNVSVK